MDEPAKKRRVEAAIVAASITAGASVLVGVLNFAGRPVVRIFENPQPKVQRVYELLKPRYTVFNEMKGSSSEVRVTGCHLHLMFRFPDPVHHDMVGRTGEIDLGSDITKPTLSFEGGQYEVKVPVVDGREVNNGMLFKEWLENFSEHESEAQLLFDALNDAISACRKARGEY